MNSNNFNEDYAIKIFGTLYSKVADGHLAFAEQIYDDTYPNGTNLGDNSQYSINRQVKKDIDAINDPNKDWTINNLRINGRSTITSPIKIWKDFDDGDYEYIDLSTDGYTFASSDDPSNHEHHYWSEFASKNYVDNRVNALINGAPDAYDTLKEISDYIISDKDAGAAILNKITNINNSIESIGSKIERVHFVSDYRDIIKNAIDSHTFVKANCLQVGIDSYSNATTSFTPGYIAFLSGKGRIQDCQKALIEYDPENLKISFTLNAGDTNSKYYLGNPSLNYNNVNNIDNNRIIVGKDLHNAIDLVNSKYYDKNTIDTKINKIIAGDVDLTEYALKTDLSNYALKSDISKYALKTDIPTVPTKISQLTNDSGYITSSEDVNTTNKSLNFDSSANSNDMNLTLTVTDSDNKSISDDIKLEKANSETAGLMSAVDRNYITFLLNKVNELESRVNELSTSGDDPQPENVDISQIPYLAIRVRSENNINFIYSGTGYTASPTKTNPTIQSAIAYKNNSSFNSEMVATFRDLVINANELKIYKPGSTSIGHIIGETVEFDFTMGETRFNNCTGTVKEWTIEHVVESSEYRTILGTFTINNINISSQHGMHPMPTTENTNRQYYTVNGNSDYFVSQFEAGKSYTITYTSSDVSKVNFKNTHIVNQDNASASTGADEISVGNIGSTKDGTVITPTINVTSQSDTELAFTIAIPSDVYCINEIIDIQYSGYRDVSLIYNY